MAWYTYSMTLASQTIASCATLFQLRSSGTPYEILRVEVSQSGSVTSVQYPLYICRRSTTAGDVAPVTPVHVGSTSEPASKMVSSSCGTGTFVSTSAFGTDGDVLWRSGGNVLSPYLYLPVPEERIWIQSCMACAVRFPIAVTSETWEGTIVWREWQ